VNDDLTSIANLLQSGGNVAMLFVVWLGLKVKSAIEGYLRAVNIALESLALAQKSVDQKLDLLLETDSHARRIRNPIELAPRHR
jgi:hypothetical protein